MTEHNRNVIIGWVVAALVVLGIVLYVKNRDDQRERARELDTNTSTEVTTPGLPADDTIDDSMTTPSDLTTPPATEELSPVNPTNDMSPTGTGSGMDTQPGVPTGSGIQQGSGTVPSDSGTNVVPQGSGVNP